MRHFQTIVALAVTALLVMPQTLPAQEPAPAKLVAQAGELKIIVIEGEGAKNNVTAKTAAQPVVEVRDEADKPVPGAEVLFQLPMTGPGGVFHGWVKTQTARTNAQGRAAASGFTPNEELGRFNIKVTATMGTKSSSVVVAQSNVRGGSIQSGSGSKSGWWKIAAVAGAAALAGGIYAGVRDGNGSSASANPITISTGPITVAGPR